MTEGLPAHDGLAKTQAHVEDVCHNDNAVPVKAKTIAEPNSLQKKKSTRSPLNGMQGAFALSEDEWQKLQLKSIRCIQPTLEELENFGTPDLTIYNAGQFPCNHYTHYMTSSTSIDLNLARREMVILGMQYAGEMKKGLFSIMHYLMPKRQILSLHFGCNMGKDGTGKTTLSTDHNRFLIGDNEHCWSDNGVSNIEGGCYAKCIDLSQEKEPDIWNAIKFGTVLENVVFDENTREVDYEDRSVTDNTQAAYLIVYITQRKDTMCCPTSKECHPSGLRCIRCAPSSELAEPGTEYVPLHQWLHRIGCWNRRGHKGVTSDVLSLLWGCIYNAAPHQVCSHAG